MDEILSDNKGVKTYSNDIFVLIKDSFKNHIYQVIINSGKMRTTGLKLNALKFSLGLKGILYLGYVITREGIKLYPKKVQGIMYIGRPSTTTEARELIGMVHYFKYIWPRRSHSVALLTEAASNNKGRKTLWK